MVLHKEMEQHGADAVIGHGAGAEDGSSQGAVALYLIGAAEMVPKLS